MNRDEMAKQLYEARVAHVAVGVPDCGPYSWAELPSLFKQVELAAADAALAACAKAAEEGYRDGFVDGYLPHDDPRGHVAIETRWTESITRAKWGDE